jgi:hypothetical protein
MGGETAEHDTIGNNLRAALHARLRGKPCREMRAMVYTREGDGRLGIQSAVLLEGVDASIEILEFGLALPFSILYEGLGDQAPTS